MVKWKCTLEHDLQLLLNITDRHIRCTRLDSNFIFNLLRQRLYKSKSCPNVSHTAKSVVGQQRHVLHVSKILSHYQTVQEVIRQVGKSWTGAYMETKRPVLFCYVPRRDNVLLQKSTQDEMVGRERLGKLTWELKFLELQTFSKCKIIFIASTCGFLALFSSHSGACSCLTIMFLFSFFLSTVPKLNRVQTQRGIWFHYQRMPSVLFSGLSNSGAVRTRYSQLNLNSLITCRQT